MQNGNDRLLYIYNVDDFYPIGCLRSNSFSESTDVLDATMRTDANGWVHAVPTTQSYEIAFDGVLSVENRGGTILTYGDIKALKRTRTKIQWKIISADGDSEEGFGYFVSLGDQAGVGEFVTFSGSILGVGSPNSTAWTPPTYGDLTDMIPAYEAAQT